MTFRPAAVMVVLALVFAACGGDAPYSLDDFVSDVETTGAEVAVGETSYWWLFLTDGTDITIDGVTVRVHEYADETDRLATSETISMANWSVNATPVEFIAPPHFWPEGRIIVLYLGEDQTIIDLITGVLGPEIR